MRRLHVLPAIVAVAALAGCGQPPSFGGTYTSDRPVAITDGPAREGALVFTVRKSTRGTDDAPHYPRPGGAVLKIPGFLPLGMDSVEEVGDSYVVMVVMPDEVVRDPALAQRRSLQAELFMPVDQGVRSFTGVERHVSDTAFIAVRVWAKDPVILPGLAEAIGGFFRGLYSAR